MAVQIVGGALLEFNKSEIATTLSARPLSLAAAFSLACARRLVNSLNSSGDEKSATSIAMSYWGAVERSLMSGATLASGIGDEIIARIPDEDDEPSLAAGVWDDALSAIWFASDVLCSSSVQAACDAASRAVDTAFRYSTRSVNSIELTDAALLYIMKGAVVQTELARQRRDLHDIARVAKPSASVPLLLTRSAQEAVLPSPLFYQIDGLR